MRPFQVLDQKLVWLGFVQWALVAERIVSRSNNGAFRRQLSGQKALDSVPSDVSGRGASGYVVVHIYYPVDWQEDG